MEEKRGEEGEMDWAGVKGRGRREEGGGRRDGWNRKEGRREE